MRPQRERACTVSSVPTCLSMLANSSCASQKVCALGCTGRQPVYPGTRSSTRMLHVLPERACKHVNEKKLRSKRCPALAVAHVAKVCREGVGCVGQHAPVQQRPGGVARVHARRLHRPQLLAVRYRNYCHHSTVSTIALLRKACISFPRPPFSSPCCHSLDLNTHSLKIHFILHCDRSASLTTNIA